MNWLIWLTLFISTEALPRHRQVTDFTILKVVGRGGQGSVRLVQSKHNYQYYAMKSIRKDSITTRSKQENIQLERDILLNVKSRWATRLDFSFQDQSHLHLVMQWLPGGDLMGLLIKESVFSETITRFYLAEIILGVEALHARGVTLRDLKPENILISADGHLKLADFGMAKDSLLMQVHQDDIEYEQLALQYDTKYRRRSADQSLPERQKSVRDRRPTRPQPRHRRSQTSVPRLETAPRQLLQHRRKFFSIVGTVDYLSPEVLTNRGYTKLCDSWAVGAIMFEMLYGGPPFYAEGQLEVVRKIVNWSQHLEFPPLPTSAPAMDLMQRLLCGEAERLTISEIKAHQFFSQVPWNTIQTYKPPFVPQNKTPVDTQYFPEEELVDVPLMLDLESQQFPQLPPADPFQSHILDEDVPQPYDRFDYDSEDEQSG